MKYFKMDIELLDTLEEELDIKFTLWDASVFCIINSYNKQGQKCTMSQGTMSNYLRCSYKTISRSLDKLSDNNIITIFKPDNQAKEKLASTYHINKDIKDLIRKRLWTKSPRAGDLESENEKDYVLRVRGLVTKSPRTGDLESSYTTKGRVSKETSFIDVPLSTETKKEKEVKIKEDWEIALEKIN